MASTPPPAKQPKQGKKKAVMTPTSPTSASPPSAPALAPSPSMTGDTLVRTGVAMSLLGVSHSTFNKLVLSGELLACQRTPGGQALFRYGDITAFIKQTNARFAGGKANAKAHAKPDLALADDDESAL